MEVLAVTFVSPASLPLLGADKKQGPRDAPTGRVVIGLLYGTPLPLLPCNTKTKTKTHLGPMEHSIFMVSFKTCWHDVLFIQVGVLKRV